MRFRASVLVLLLFSLSLIQPDGRCEAGSTVSTWAISGKIVTENGAAFGWVVIDTTTGTISKVCESFSDVPSNARLLRHGGYIFPGLIDTHNHAHWNSVPMWRPGKTYGNRYEWQATSEYWTEVRYPYYEMASSGLWDLSLAYSEVRALIGGTTMVQGSDGAIPGFLVRNLDYDHWGAYSYVRDIVQADPDFLYQAKLALKFGLLNRLFLHVGEGRSSNTRAAEEFPFLEDAGLATSGVVVIHGVALTEDDFETMADEGMYLVWSPKSNLVLYGETADVVAALDAGVTVALGPDWSISGSDNLLEELKVAYEYSVNELDGALTPADLFRMVTSDAAKVAGVDSDPGRKLGRIAAGYQADLFLAPKFDSDAHVSLLKTHPKDIDLVLIDGKPLYGDRNLMKHLVDSDALDQILVERKKKALCLSGPSFTPPDEIHFEDVTDSLDDVLDPLAPLIEDEPGSKPGTRRNLPK